MESKGLQNHDLYRLPALGKHKDIKTKKKATFIPLLKIGCLKFAIAPFSLLQVLLYSFLENLPPILAS